MKEKLEKIEKLLSEAKALSIDVENESTSAWASVLRARIDSALSHAGQLRAFNDPPPQKAGAARA